MGLVTNLKSKFGKNNKDKLRRSEIVIEDVDTYGAGVGQSGGNRKDRFNEYEYDEDTDYDDEYEDEEAYADDYDDDDEYYDDDDQEYDPYDDYDDVDDSVNVASIIPDKLLETIREDLINSHAGIVIEGMTNPEKRKELEQEIRSRYKNQTRGLEAVVKYIARETVGTGVVEDIIANDESITDIGYNGTHLIIESNDNKWIYDTDQDINDRYIIRLVNKFALANGKDFTDKNPTFDGKYENIRVNAVYDTNTISGVTMALRVVRPKLALIKDNFELFAPEYVYDLLEAGVAVQSNFVIAGETGTGKTELQKLLASFIPFDERIVLIEDTAETFLKDMFPDKDVFSWITSADVSITQLIASSLRANPRWIIVSETRGKEAYEMIQAVLSGHSIITTLHTAEARAIPTRLVNMAKMGYEFSEEGLKQDIRRYFDFGLHIIREQYNGKTIRYLSELIYFQDDREDKDEGQVIFKQEMNHETGEIVAQVGELPEALRRKMHRYGRIPESLQENMCHMRQYHTTEEYDDDRGVQKTRLTIEDVGLMNENQLDDFGTEEAIVDFSKLSDSHSFQSPMYQDDDEYEDDDDTVIDLSRTRTENVYGADNQASNDIFSSLANVDMDNIEVEGAKGRNKASLKGAKSDPKAVGRRKMDRVSGHDAQNHAQRLLQERENKRRGRPAKQPYLIEDLSQDSKPTELSAKESADRIINEYKNKKKNKDRKALPSSMKQAVNR